MWLQLVTCLLNAGKASGQPMSTTDVGSMPDQATISAGRASDTVYAMRTKSSKQTLQKHAALQVAAPKIQTVQPLVLVYHSPVTQANGPSSAVHEDVAHLAAPPSPEQPPASSKTLPATAQLTHKGSQGTHSSSPSRPHEVPPPHELASEQPWPVAAKLVPSTPKDPAACAHLEAGHIFAAQLDSKSRDKSISPAGGPTQAGLQGLPPSVKTTIANSVRGKPA